MARLLLVDDNPSIHKIAETLLGASYVELVCVESAEAALGLLDAGEAFDIALIDTTMPGMDGWELLNRLRANPATARIPVAMMAGVLDTVDPQRLATAPIQGFLKKPIELRDLPDRVRQLLGTPVSAAPPPPPAAMPEYVPTLPSVPEPSPYATQPPGTPLPSIPASVDPADLETMPPGTKLTDLTGASGVEPGDLVTLPPGTKLSDLSTLSPSATTPGLQLDLLLLTPEDLLVEEAPAAEPELDLEELDLETLRNLPLEGVAAVAAVSAPAPMEASAPAPELTPESLDLTPPTGHAPPQGTEPTWEALPVEPAAMAFPMDLPEPAEPAQGFEVVSGEVLDVPAGAPDSSLPEPAPGLELGAAPPSADLPPIQTMDLDADLLPPMETSLEAWPPEAEPLPTSHPLAAAMAAGPAPVPAPLPAPVLPPAAPPPALVADLGQGPAADLVRALMADPALMDALARAVVARLGDQALREIAWEVMPELAEKLHRPS
jgi:CheY-like chemotaxis protein